MSGERYVGEGRALWHFLAEIRPLVAEELGEDAFLRHHIDRALKTSDLEMLRQARRVFHSHPDEVKRRLMRGLFDNTVPGEELPFAPPEVDMTPMRDESPKPDAVIRFDAHPAASEDEIGLSVELSQDAPGTAAPIRVAVKPGTLPRSAAEALRQIADWIEHDRRILSRQHWIGNNGRIVKADETVDQA